MCILSASALPLRYLRSSRLWLCTRSGMLSASATRPSHPTSCRHFTTRIKQRCPKTTSSAHARRSRDAATSRRGRLSLADFQIEALQGGARPPNRGAQKGDGLKMDGLDGAHFLEQLKGGARVVCRGSMAGSMLDAAGQPRRRAGGGTRDSKMHRASA